MGQQDRDWYRDAWRERRKEHVPSTVETQNKLPTATRITVPKWLAFFALYGIGALGRDSFNLMKHFGWF
jgi:hypothetical protein